MIDFRNVTVQFESGTAIRDLNFSVEKGEFVYLVGASGSGKSSILKMIYMDLFPNRGEVTVGKYKASEIPRRKIPQLRRRIGMIFQDYRLLKDRDVYSNIALPLQIAGRRQGDIHTRVRKAAQEVGLKDRLNQYPDELSGGEQQRVAIARALIKNPLILLADEPTGNLDADITAEIIKLIWRINEKGTAVLMATHDMDLVKMEPARTLRVDDGRMVGEMDS